MNKLFTWIISLLAVLSIGLITLIVKSKPSSRPATSRASCFRAAVLDHVQQKQYRTLNEERFKNIELNLRVYESAVKLAKENNVNLIVFPENGIVHNILTNEEALAHSEQLSLDVNYCSNSGGYAKTHPIATKLSCLASSGRMYLAANMLDKVPCTSAQETTCPSSKNFVFNTAVLFDPDGKLLARYHKMQPFHEFYLNTPPKEELIVVETEYGRWSLEVCFDMIFEKPATYLAQRKQFDTLIFPTWWFDESPFLSAAQYQLGWALKNKVNLLASNIHAIEVGSMGSGIYWGGQQQFESITEEDHASRLLIANVPVEPSKSQCSMDAKVLYVPQVVNNGSDTSVYAWGRMDMTGVAKKAVPESKGGRVATVSECSGGVCCTLTYEYAVTNQYEPFYLIVANRTRPGYYPWTEEFCGLVHCKADQSPCTTIRTNRELATRFKNVTLVAELGLTTAVHASVIGSRHQVLPQANLWSYKTEVNKKSGKQVVKLSVNPSGQMGQASIGTVGLYGRVYERDPPYKQIQEGKAKPKLFF